MYFLVCEVLESDFIHHAWKESVIFIGTLETPKKKKLSKRFYGGDENIGLTQAEFMLAAKGKGCDDEKLLLDTWNTWMEEAEMFSTYDDSHHAFCE